MLFEFLIDFVSMDGDFGGSFDAKTHLVATDVDDSDDDAITDDNGFVALSGENEHGLFLSFGLRSYYHRDW